jgi:diguanylate cyclase (GGDEF)-like protein
LLDRLTELPAVGRRRLGEAVDAALRYGKEIDVEVSVGDPAHRRCGVAVRPLRDGSERVTGALLCVSDVTEAVRLREELTDRATFDALTRTLNRAATITALEAALDNPGAGVGVVFVDLDGFKDVNDRRGHAVGDRLLAYAAARLGAAAREADVVGRIGGDEFLVVCRNVPGPAFALEIGARLAASLREPTDVDGEPLVPRASLGVTWSAGEGITADGLIARADMAMYESKSRQGTPVLR